MGHLSSPNSPPPYIDSLYGREGGALSIYSMAPLSNSMGSIGVGWIDGPANQIESGHLSSPLYPPFLYMGERGAPYLYMASIYMTEIRSKPYSSIWPNLRTLAPPIHRDREGVESDISHQSYHVYNGMDGPRPPATGAHRNRTAAPPPLSIDSRF